mmetsp:Transcript_50415/g.151868  ORF Transcript_50415/g.151868 Transcript_50415/m.151868 type:complete len:82 (+) Transcript_50415:1537-1782(+)
MEGRFLPTMMPRTAAARPPILCVSEMSLRKRREAALRMMAMAKRTTEKECREEENERNECNASEHTLDFGQILRSKPSSGN